MREKWLDHGSGSIKFDIKSISLDEKETTTKSDLFRLIAQGIIERRDYLQKNRFINQIKASYR